MIYDKYESLNNYLKTNYLHAFKIKDYRQAPSCHGIYFIVAEWEDIWRVDYIGSSKNLKQRLSSHDIYKKIKRKCTLNLFIYVLPMSLDEYCDCETCMIKTFRPNYNIMHTGRRRIYEQ